MKKTATLFIKVWHLPGNHTQKSFDEIEEKIIATVLGTRKIILEKAEVDVTFPKEFNSSRNSKVTLEINCKADLKAKHLGYIQNSLEELFTTFYAKTIVSIFTVRTS